MRRLDMLAPLYPIRDIRLSGQVVYTGTSSMEVAVKMEGLGPNGEEETQMLGVWFPVGIFTFTQSSVQVALRWFAEMRARVKHTQSTLWSSRPQKNKHFTPWERVGRHC